MIRHSFFSLFPCASLTSQVTGNCETLKPGRTKIRMECYCVASKKPIRHEKTKPQTAIAIVCGFQVSLHAPNFPLICQYTISIYLSESNQEFAVFWTCIVKLILVHSTAATVTHVVPIQLVVFWFLLMLIHCTSFFSVIKTAENFSLSPFCISEKKTAKPHEY